MRKTVDLPSNCPGVKGKGYVEFIQSARHELLTLMSLLQRDNEAVKEGDLVGGAFI